MALVRLATPTTGTVIDATTHYITEFDNIYSNALALISPLTGNLDVNEKQLVSMRVENVTATPTAANAGRLTFNTTGKQLQLDDASQIRAIPALYGTNAGDLVYATSSGQYGTLPIQSSFNVLTATGSAPSWGTYLTVTGLNNKGSLVVGGGSNAVPERWR